MLLAASLFVPVPRSQAEWGGVGGLSAQDSQPAPEPVSGDTDGDGIPDAWESANLLNPANPADAASDFDRDGLTALQEYGLHLGTAGAHGKHLGTWSASWLPRPAGFTIVPSVTIIECAPNGVILARVQGRLSGSSITTSYPYTWSPVTGAWTRVQPPPGFEAVTSLTPLDVNASGQVVGYFSSGGTKGFLWTPAGTGGQSVVYQLDSGGTMVAAVPKRISDTGYIAGNVGTLSGRSFAGTDSGDEITFPDLWTNPVYHDVNDYGEFIGTVYDPVARRNVTFLAVPGFPAFSTGIGGEALDDMAGVWGAIPEIDPAEIVWMADPSGYGYFREGTAIDQNTGEIVRVHEGYGASFYWYHGGAWYSYPGFSQNLAAVNDWGEFAGLYSSSMSSTYFYGGSQSSGQSLGDNGIFFFEGDYHVSKARPAIYGVSNDPRVLIGTPYAVWSGSLVVPVASLLPAGYPTTFAYARLADSGRVILQQSTSAQILVLKPNQDSDGDGMPNDWEVFYGFNPTYARDGSADANQNGTSNRAEFVMRANPLAAAGAAGNVQFIDLRPGIDSDGDGMPNVWEWRYGLNHSEASDAIRDDDGDRLTNLSEFLLGTDPNNNDADGDGVMDGDEARIGTNPLVNVDMDSDALPDDWERYFSATMLELGAPPEHWGANWTALASGNLDPHSTLQEGGMTFQEIHAATTPDDFRIILHDVFIQAKRAEFTFGVTHDSTDFDEEGRPTTYDFSGNFYDGSSYGSGSIECWSRTPTTTLHQLAVQLDPFAVTPEPTLAWFNNESLHAAWTDHTYWGDPSRQWFPIEEIDQSSITFQLSDGGSSKYYQFQETWEDGSAAITETRWLGQTRKSKFRLYRPRPTKDPAPQQFLRITKQYALLSFQESILGENPPNAPVNINRSLAEPITEIEVITATIPAFGHTSEWIETTPATVPQKELVVSLLPLGVVELSPKVKDEKGNEIEGSAKPNQGELLTPFVENGLHGDRIAHRELKVRIGEALKNKKVTWTLEPLFIPGYAEVGPNLPPIFRGEWSDSPIPAHQNAFEASSVYGENEFKIVSGEGETATAETTVSNDGFTAVRVNVPPIGFNKARVMIQIEGVNEPINLIDMEVPAVIVIDPGHGTGPHFGDSNVIGGEADDSEVPEHAFALDVALRTRREIRAHEEAQRRNIRVFLTRENETNISATARTRVAMENGCDVYMSIHFNDSTSRLHRDPFGMWDITGNLNVEQDQALAIRLRQAVQAAIFEVEPAESRDADRSQYDSEYWENHPGIQKGLDTCSDFQVVNGEPRPYNGNVLGYTPCRAALIEIEWMSHSAADALFNAAPLMEQMRSATASALADACIRDAIVQPE